MKNKIILFPLVSLILTGCGISTSKSSLSSSEKSSSQSEKSSSTESQSETSYPWISESSEESSLYSSSTSEAPSPVDPSDVEFGDIFYNPANKIKITIKMSNEAAYKLSMYGNDSKNKTADIYHPATLTLNVNSKTYTFEEVGVRIKGNLSRPECFIGQDGKIIEPANLKISFSTNFKDNDYYTPNTDPDVLKERRFAGAKKIDFKWNRNLDNTFTKEAYAYNMFNQEGLMASRINIIDFTIKTDSDTRSIKMSAQECIDKQYLTRVLSKSKAKGNLYKGNWPCDLTKADSIGVEDCTKGYFPVYDLKTNDDVPDHSLLKNLISKMNENDSGKTQAELKQKLDSLVDADSFIKYAALSWVTGNPDDLRYNKNNSYFYFNSDNKMVIIPRDTDRCFGILETWNVDLSTRYPTSTKDYTGYDFVTCPLFWRSVIHSDGADQSKQWPVISEYENKYKEYCIEYYNKYLNVEAFSNFTKGFKNAPSTDISIGGYSNLNFAKYVEGKTSALKGLGWIK